MDTSLKQIDTTNTNTNTKKLTIGFADIVGDLFHYNHINFFKKCKMYCDYLIIGVCSDDFCKGYKRPPILDENERIYTVGECQYVDKTLLINETDYPFSKDFMDLHRIDIVFHAHTLEESSKYDKYYIYPINQNKFKRLDYSDGVSTSKLIQKIKDNY